MQVVDKCTISVFKKKIVEKNSKTIIEILSGNQIGRILQSS
jgi:hypothetical protein